MSERVVLTIGTKKGVFVAEASKPRRKFALRGPFGAGVPVYCHAGRHPGHADDLCVELQPVLRHEGPEVEEPREDLHGDQVRAGVSQGRWPRLANIWSLEPGTAKNELWCGVEPASLFRSRDGGD